MARGKAGARKVFKDLIREAIYDAIVNGDLKPGDRIIEMEWADRFDSSQAPVREAIRELESLGVVESLPFKGASVRALSGKELRDIHSVRAGLESVALRNAIRKATDEDIAGVRKILDEMEAAAVVGDRDSFVEKDIAFHEEIVMLAHTTELKKLWAMCNVRIWTAISTDNTQKEMIQLAESHEPIYKVLEERDEAKVFEVMMRHFEEIAETVYEDDE